MVSALDSGLGGQGWTPGPGVALIAFLVITLIVPFFTQVCKWLPVDLMLGSL